MHAYVAIYVYICTYMYMNKLSLTSDFRFLMIAYEHIRIAS